MSCEENHIEPVNDDESVTVETESFVYHYNNKRYDVDEWKSQFGSIEGKSVVMVNDHILVYDKAKEARNMGEIVQKKLKGDKLNNSEIMRSAVLVDIISGYDGSDPYSYAFRLNYYQHKNSSGDYLTIFVGKKISVRSWDNRISNNSGLMNFPSDWRNIASSYQFEYIESPRIPAIYPGAPNRELLLNIKTYSGLNADGVDWNKTLSGRGATNSDGDLSNNRIWGSLGIGNWNDQFESVKYKVH
ncbi:MAG: hypothetical protein ACJAWV_003032 [Flammeovirgaceae bacterium]|jgi:hypothetical protein